MLASNVTSHIFTEDKWQFVALVKFMDFHKLQHRHSSCWLSNDELLTTQHTVCVLTNLVSSVVLRWIYGCAESSILEDTQQTNTHRPNWRVSICRKPVPHNCIMLHVQSLSGIIGIYWSRSLFIKYHLWSDEMAKEEEWLTFDSLQYLSLSGSFRLPLSYTFIIGTAHRIRCILSKLAIGSWWWRTTNEWIDCIESSVHEASQQLHCILRISGV